MVHFNLEQIGFLVQAFVAKFSFVMSFPLPFISMCKSRDKVDFIVILKSVNAMYKIPKLGLFKNNASRYGKVTILAIQLHKIGVNFIPEQLTCI